MNIYSFLSHLRSLDVKLFLDGERLRMQSPQGNFDTATPGSDS